jgi:phage terminase Nu1 subunit (DNA packaging protein)
MKPQTKPGVPSFTLRQLCFLFDCTPIAITNLAKAGIVVKLGRDRYAAASVPNYISKLRSRGAGTDAWHEARTRKAVEQARKLEYERLVRDGEYAPRERFVNDLAKIGYAVKARLLLVPTKIGSLVRHKVGDAMAAELAALAKKLLYDALRELSEACVDKDGRVIRYRHSRSEAAE